MSGVKSWMKTGLSERVELVKLYYRNNRSCKVALRAFRDEHNLSRVSEPCSSRTLTRIVEKFEKTGSLLDKLRSGRPQTSQRKSEMVSQALGLISRRTRHGESSLREISALTGVARSTVHMLVRNVLALHPYRIRRLHRLTRPDFHSRMVFAGKCLSQMSVDQEWIRQVMWTDEAHFHLHGSVNTHNCVIWSKEAPRVIAERRLHDSYITVWCGFTADTIIGPYFFEEATISGFKRVTVTGRRYADMLKNFVIPTLVDRGILSTVVFQQDGAPAHTHAEVLSILRRTFKHRVISRGFEFEWPSRSPDLSPLDFWLWGYLKSRIYLNAPETIDQLKASIRSEIINIRPDQLQSAVGSFWNRVRAALQNNGGHVELFR